MQAAIVDGTTPALGLSHVLSLEEKKEYFASNTLIILRTEITNKRFCNTRVLRAHDTSHALGLIPTDFNGTNGRIEYSHKKFP